MRYVINVLYTNPLTWGCYANGTVPGDMETMWAFVKKKCADGSDICAASLLIEIATVSPNNGGKDVTR